MNTIYFAPYKKAAKIIHNNKEFDCKISFYKQLNPTKKNFAHAVIIWKLQKFKSNMIKDSIFLIDETKYKITYNFTYESDDFIFLHDMINSYQENELSFSMIENE